MEQSENIVILIIIITHIVTTTISVVLIITINYICDIICYLIMRSLFLILKIFRKIEITYRKY